MPDARSFPSDPRLLYRKICLRRLARNVQSGVFHKLNDIFDNIFQLEVSPIFTESQMSSGQRTFDYHIIQFAPRDAVRLRKRFSALAEETTNPKSASLNRGFSCISFMLERCRPADIVMPSTPASNAAFKRAFKVAIGSFIVSFSMQFTRTNPFLLPFPSRRQSIAWKLLKALQIELLFRLICLLNH